MVTVSKTPEVTVARPRQPPSLFSSRETWPPAAMVEGCTLKPNGVTLLFSSPAKAAGAVKVRAVTPSSAAEATRIARMVSLQVPEEPCRGPFPLAPEMRLDDRNARKGSARARSQSREWGNRVGRTGDGGRAVGGRTRRGIRPPAG